MKQLRGYEGKKNTDSRAQQLYGEAMRKYGGMSEEALVGRLVEMVRAQKKNGTFDEVQLLGFVNTLSPLLSPVQRQRLESVLGMIDE